MPRLGGLADPPGRTPRPGRVTKSHGGAVTDVACVDAFDIQALLQRQKQAGAPAPGPSFSRRSRDGPRCRAGRGNPPDNAVLLDEEADPVLELEACSCPGAGLDTSKASRCGCTVALRPTLCRPGRAMDRQPSACGRPGGSGLSVLSTSRLSVAFDGHRRSCRLRCHPVDRLPFHNPFQPLVKRRLHLPTVWRSVPRTLPAIALVRPMLRLAAHSRSISVQRSSRSPPSAAAARTRQATPVSSRSPSSRRRLDRTSPSTNPGMPLPLLGYR